MATVQNGRSVVKRLLAAEKRLSAARARVQSLEAQKSSSSKWTPQEDQDLCDAIEELVNARADIDAAIADLEDTKTQCQMAGP